MNKICTEIKADLPEVKVGNLLREAREGHQINDLNVIVRELCIKPHLLEALEKGIFDSFPSACYTTGFLKNYAAFLGLDTKEIIAKYAQEHSGLKKAVVLTFPEVKKSKFSIGKLIGATSFSAALLTGVWITSSTLDAEEISNGYLATEVKVEQAAPVATVISLQEEKGMLTSREVEEQTRVIKTFTSGENNIQLKAKEDVWVRISTTDGSIIVEQILAKGDTFTHPHEAGLVLMTNNAAAISLSVGSKIIKSLGKKGEIIENLALEQEKLLEYSMVH